VEKEVEKVVDLVERLGYSLIRQLGRQTMRIVLSTRYTFPKLRTNADRLNAWIGKGRRRAARV
jgi:hypothetical protein